MINLGCWELVLRDRAALVCCPAFSRSLVRAAEAMDTVYANGQTLRTGRSAKPLKSWIDLCAAPAHGCSLIRGHVEDHHV